MFTLEDKRVMVTSGTDTRKIPSIASSHPFTQQVDIVFPSSPPLEIALRNLRLTYYTCDSSLADFLRFAQPHVNQGSPESKIIALGLAGPTDSDVWSLDPRGVLTLAVAKRTYESLGLVADSRLPWKETEDIHVIHISLENATVKSGNMEYRAKYGPKEAAALQQWDAKRGPWKIAFCLQNTGDDLPPGSVIHNPEQSLSRRDNVHIPDLGQDVVVSTERGKGRAEDWDESVSALFEWVGLASLGSQRLSASDKCDPYIAVYAPPEPSHVGELTVMRWIGLIPPNFLRSIIDVILSPNNPIPRIVCISGHSVPTSPVTYVPDNPLKMSPLRSPRAESEDTWSLVLSRDENWWVLSESVGRWDKRWG